MLAFFSNVQSENLFFLGTDPRHKIFISTPSYQYVLHSNRKKTNSKCLNRSGCRTDSKNVVFCCYRFYFKLANMDYSESFSTNYEGIKGGL